MGLILNQKYVGKHTYWSFISNRFLRIFPLYWLIALLTLVVTLGVGGPHEALKEVESLSWLSRLVLGFANIFIGCQSSLPFFQLNAGHLQFALGSDYGLLNFMLVPQAWSLDIELLFYAIAPFLVRGRWPVLVIWVAVFAGVRFAVRAWVFQLDPLSMPSVNYFFFGNQLVFFMIGALMYRVYEDFGDFWTPSRAKILTVCVCLSVLWFEHVPVPGPIKTKGLYLLVALGLPALFKWSLHSSWDRWVGELSYPIYINHVLVLSLIQLLPLDIHALGVWTCMGSVIMAIILVHTISLPLEHYRQSRVRSMAISSSTQEKSVPLLPKKVN